MSTTVRAQRVANTAGQSAAADEVRVDTFTDGVLDPGAPMLGPVRSGGRIIAASAPGCWGPMITPALRGGHEATQPVAVAGAEVGDALAIHIERIEITSRATASGCDRALPGRFVGDPFVAAKCPGCGRLRPRTVPRGIGRESIRCAECGADATPFHISHGYTIAFGDAHRVGVTLDRAASERIAHDAVAWSALPEQSVQNPILTFAPHDLVGVPARLRPFLGQLGTTPGVPLPDSHNAGDFGSFLIGAPHDLAVTPEQLQFRTDGHMDIDAVRAGAIVICPVKASGGGVYLGDMHAMQGDGEIAGHTCDVAGITTLRVEVLKGLTIDGPVLLPRADDLPPLARPFTADELADARNVARAHGLAGVEETLPISVVGTGVDLNLATDNGLRRAAALLQMPVEEVRNRATIAGAIEIGRHPGVVQVTFHAPVERLERCGLLSLARSQYGAGG